MIFSLVRATYIALLQPVAPFSWFGSPVSTLDVLAICRLCIAMRQLREAVAKSHSVATRSKPSAATVEPRSFIKDAVAVLVVVYGGEAITSPWLGITPSFMFSPVVPGLYVAVTAAVENLIPALPTFSFETEFPLSFLDGLTRAFLLCQMIPPLITTLGVPELSTSPWTLLLSSLLLANGGYFYLNMFSMLSPTGFQLATPPELLPNGWQTTDLWCAPLITGTYAMLTHAQPFWANAHALLYNFTGVGTTNGNGEVNPVDPESARAFCALLLTGMFVTRTAKIFGPAYVKKVWGPKDLAPIDGKRIPEPIKEKTQ